RWLVCGNNNLNTGQTHLAIQLRKLSENWQTPPYTNYRASGLVLATHSRHSNIRANVCCVPLYSVRYTIT
ncbi:MAG: hypothetical protein ACREYE_17265, partial [Gammaproteobacteria bacterium]